MLGRARNQTGPASDWVTYEASPNAPMWLLASQSHVGLNVAWWKESVKWWFRSLAEVLRKHL